MKIFGLIIGKPRARTHYRRASKDRFEEAASKMLLEIARRDTGAMVAVINKYCHIKLNHDFELQEVKDKIRVKVFEKAEETIRSGRTPAFDRRVKEIINMILQVRHEPSAGRNPRILGLSFRPEWPKGAKISDRKNTLTGSKHGSQLVEFLQYLNSIFSTAREDRHGVQGERMVGVRKTSLGNTGRIAARYPQERTPGQPALISGASGNQLAGDGTNPKSLAIDADKVNDSERGRDSPGNV